MQYLLFLYIFVYKFVLLLYTHLYICTTVFIYIYIKCIIYIFLFWTMYKKVQIPLLYKSSITVVALVIYFLYFNHLLIFLSISYNISLSKIILIVIIKWFLRLNPVKRIDFVLKNFFIWNITSLIFKIFQNIEIIRLKHFLYYIYI